MRPAIFQKFIKLTLVLLVLTGLLQAQYIAKVPSIPGITLGSGNPALESARFLGLDLSKISFQNSYSMSVNSMGGETVAMGLLKSSFNYVINPQVQVRGYVGLLHTPFASVTPTDSRYSFINNLDRDHVVYGGEITYQPRENMLLQIGFNHLPTYPQNQFYQPFGYRPTRY